MSAFKAHCSFGLWGAEMAQQLRADGVASSDGMGTFGRIASVDQLPPKSQLLAYVQEGGTARSPTGERTKAFERRQLTHPKPNRVAKADTPVPEALTLALKKHMLAAKHFAAMSAQLSQGSTPSGSPMPSATQPENAVSHRPSR